MAARVTVEGYALDDPRFAKLARRVGLADGDHARGKLERVWSYCTDKHIYFVDAETFDLVSGVDGLALAACLPEVALAEETSRGIRVRGTRGRIEWKKNLRDNAVKGGRQTAARRRAKQAPDAPPEERPPSPSPSPSEKEITPCPAVPADEVKAEPPEAMNLASLLAEAIETRAKDQPKDLRPDRRAKTLASWAREFRLANERDGRPWPRLQKVLEWSQADSFWSANIRSASKFRAQFDALAARMEQPATRPSGGRPQAEPPKYKDDGYVY